METVSSNGSGHHYRALSACTIENVRYRLGDTPLFEHDNEDRWFETHDVSKPYQVVALFDGHDGPRAVDYVRKYVKNELERARSVTLTTLQELFVETETDFFENIRIYVEERQRLRNAIPPVGAVTSPTPQHAIPILDGRHGAVA